MRESNTAALSVPNADAMRTMGRALGNAVAQTRGHALVITVQGELGAGKTTLVSGLLNALGVPGPVRSPTYTLIEPYETGAVQVYHMDLYRLTDAREVEALGIRDLLTTDSALLIEWPERGEGVLPQADLEIAIDYADDVGRHLSLAAGSAAGRQLLEHFRRAVD